MLYSLGWDIEELSKLNQNGRKLVVEIDLLKELIKDDSRRDETNLPRKLKELREMMTCHTKGVTRHKRMAATHVYVVMISTEQREHKPYALPVQCLPYVSLATSTARSIVNNIVAQMALRGMKIAGRNFTSSRYMYMAYVCFTFAQGLLAMESIIPCG